MAGCLPVGAPPEVEIVEWAANRNFSMLAPSITEDVTDDRVPA